MEGGWGIPVDSTESTGLSLSYPEMGQVTVTMDKNLLAVITAAIQAYIESENGETQRHFGQKLNPWKMAARRETMSRHHLAVRGNPAKMRLRRFSLR